MNKLTVFTWLFFCTMFVGCLQEGSRVQPTSLRNVTSNSLPLELIWSAKATLAASGTPMACSGKHGVIAGIMSQENKELEGTILFDKAGNVLWHKPEQNPSAVALDDEQVFVYKVETIPNIVAYEIESGTQRWASGEALDYRQGIPFLNVENGRLNYRSTDQINDYDTNNGTLLSGESVPTENLYLRQSGIDIYDGNGYHLYATVAGEPQTYLWATEFDIGLSPHVFNDALIVRMRQQVCSLKLDDGQINWCSDKQINSNIAVYGEIGYVLNFDGQLVAFRLNDGLDVGSVEFSSTTPASGNFITTCDGHLLAHLRSPDQVFWFDFIDAD
ncbi:MAG: hypothetical protein IPM53_22980 [Anaerolineaceae bacterium]|nr:hypothetical protein [Anaerolineaceae bacterium]